MPKTYFIGGAPRSGKTTVIQELIAQKPMLATSSDAIRSVAKGILTPQSNPRLFKTARGKFGSEQHITAMKNEPERVLEYELGEAEETWKSVLNFISYYQADGKAVAIEGVAVIPGQLASADLDYKAVYIVNLTDQTEAILKYAHANSSDWINKYDDEIIRAFCSFNQLWNRYYAEEANKYNFPVVEVDSLNFSASIRQAVDILIS